MNINNKVALIPGAGRPVGRAIADLFGKNGAHLVLPCFDDWPDANNEMEAAFAEQGYSYSCYPCDLTSSTDVKDLISGVSSQFGALHYLINNIERGGMPIVHGSYDHPLNKSQWQLEFDTTVKAKWELFQRALPLIVESGGGSVTNISSIAGIIGRSGPASYLYNDGYSCANRGLQLLTETWAREASPAVRVNEVMLGLVQGRHGENTRGWDLLSPEQRESLIHHTLLHRTAHPVEIAELVYFISVQASYVTGSRLVADGGYRLGGEKTVGMPQTVLSPPSHP